MYLISLILDPPLPISPLYGLEVHHFVSHSTHLLLDCWARIFSATLYLQLVGELDSHLRRLVAQG